MSRSCVGIGIVSSSDLWTCVDKGMLRIFLPELPPPTHGMDVARTELDSLLDLL